MLPGSVYSCYVVGKLKMKLAFLLDLPVNWYSATDHKGQICFSPWPFPIQPMDGVTFMVPGCLHLENHTWIQSAPVEFRVPFANTSKSLARNLPLAHLVAGPRLRARRCFFSRRCLGRRCRCTSGARRCRKPSRQDAVNRRMLTQD